MQLRKVYVVKENKVKHLPSVLILNLLEPNKKDQVKQSTQYHDIID